MVEVDKATLRQAVSTLYTIIRSFSSYIPLYVSIEYLVDKEGRTIKLGRVSILDKIPREAKDGCAILFVATPNHRINQKCLEGVVRKVVLDAYRELAQPEKSQHRLNFQREI